MTEEYAGEERRSEYCPVHHIKCGEWKATEKEMKTKVPIWVFKIFVGILVTVLGTTLGYMNYTAINEQKDLMTALNTHMEQSAIVFSKVTHSLNEVALNQRTVMKKLELEFQPIPHY